MLLNDNKGSFGMFSRAGKNTAEKYNILMRKDEILNGRNKKVKVADIYTPDDLHKIQNENNEDSTIDIFGTETNGNNKKVKLMKKKQNFRRKESKFFKSQKKKPVKKLENPSCTKYNPKHEYIWKKTTYSQNWDTSIRKHFSKVPKEEVEPKFYISHTNFKVDGKNFIDLGRQTFRGPFSTTNDVRIRNVRSADPAQEIEKVNNESNDSKFYESEFNLLTTKQKLTNSNSNLSKEKFVDDAKNQKWKIKAPDFRKTISRAQIEKMNDDKRTVIPFSLPNFKQTTARPLMLVKYDKMTERFKESKKNYSNYERVDMDYDPYKVLHNINNHKKPTTPNFNLMTSRPNDPSISLPCYMQKLYNRQSASMITEKSLKMNNFSEGKFVQTQTCFWPKKSYNKIINLNLLNSKKFLDNVGLNSTDNPKLKEINDYIQKSMKFYNKNFDDLLKESMLSKFDNVTYRTIKRENKLMDNELDKFLLNFEKSEVN